MAFSDTGMDIRATLAKATLLLLFLFIYLFILVPPQLSECHKYKWTDLEND